MWRSGPDQPYRASSMSELASAAGCRSAVAGRRAGAPQVAGEYAGPNLLGGQREQHVVAPSPVDVQVARGLSFAPEAELLDHVERGGVLRPDRDLDPVQSDDAEAVVDHQGHGGRRDAAASHCPIDPVTDLGPPSRSPGDAGDRHLADQLLVVRRHEGQPVTASSLPMRLANHTGEGGRDRTRSGWERGLPLPQPLAVARSHRSPGGRVTTSNRPHGDPFVRQDHRPSSGQDRPLSPAPALVPRSPASSAASASDRGWSPPRTWSTACGSTSRSTASPSRTPPREPGRLTITVRPATPARPLDSIAVGTPAATPYARIASARPGISYDSTARVRSGVWSVGLTPVPPVVTTASAPDSTASRSARSTGSPSGTTSGSPTSKPHSRKASTINGPPVSAYTPAAARLDAVTTTARGRAPPGVMGQPVLDQSPLLPPDLRSIRMSVIDAPLSTALIMSYTVSAATETAVRASISTPVRSVVRTVAAIATASSSTSNSTVTPLIASG